MTLTWLKQGACIAAHFAPGQTPTHRFAKTANYLSMLEAANLEEECSMCVDGNKPEGNNPEPVAPDDLSIVCFGASAGGFGAYCTILSLLPPDTGMAYIILHHQSSDGRSQLTAILPRFTDMPVVLVSDGEVVKANTVYVVPPDKEARLQGNTFTLEPRSKTHGWPQNITRFLLSLAQSRQKNAIAVILSGLDHDGSAALESVKQGGGMVIAQSFESAPHADMPINAVRTGCVDYLLQPAEIAILLQQIGRDRALNSPGSGW